MALQPFIETERLRLRPFELTDAAGVQRLAGAREIADTTLLIPHPYPDGAAETWISTHAGAFEKGESASFAITLRKSGELCGAIGLGIQSLHCRAELGYWMGLPYWGKGFCTEAASGVLRFGFATLKLNRIFACHFKRNPASGRVLVKIGMRYEGASPQHVLKNGQFEDVELFGMVASDWQLIG